MFDVPSRMRAAVIHRFGGPEVLELQELPTPRPGPGEILVRVHAVSVNRSLDLGARQGTYDRLPALPAVLGVDPSGVVVAHGSEVRDPPIGTRVTSFFHSHACGNCKRCLAHRPDQCPDVERNKSDAHHWGGYAEYAVGRATNAIKIPDDVSFPVATVVVRHFPAAFSLANRASLQPGEWLLVMGAAGALGSAAVQVGKMLGARVIAGAGAPDRVAAAMALGADFGVDYRQTDLVSEVMKMTDGHGVDVAFENSSDSTLWPAAQRSLADYGRLVTAGAHAGAEVTLDSRLFYHRHQSLFGAPTVRAPT